ncbi:hypothetical protein HK101_007205 [Irineochytrium annulatum]|nr:hypothetical protein HK101_007205 [Irineochytrium annulatum]
MPPPTWPASSFTSAYVGKAVRSDATWDVITRGLRAGVPFVESGFAVMVRVLRLIRGWPTDASFLVEQVMIDISGYSGFTSALATAGKVSSEVISSTISKYLDGLIKLLHEFGGDVVKFLGDAVLVSFSPYDEDASSRAEVARRVILCCATVMTDLPRVEVDLSSYVNIGEIPELDLDSSPAKVALADREPIAYESTTEKMPANSSRKVSATNSNGFSSSAPASRLSLSLHVGVTCGMVERCIIGSPDTRMDYVIHGECLDSMSHVLDGTAKDQVGVSDVAWALAGYDLKGVLNTSAGGFIILTSDHFLSIASTPVLDRSLSPGAAPTVALTDEDNARFLKFLPTALAHRIMEARREHLAGLTVSEGSEYRFITAAFVKLKWRFTASLAQRCMSAFIGCVNKHHGVFQQFAVDDKGQTMLAFFGVPPFHKGNCSVNAAAASLEFLKAWREQQPNNEVAISLATGEILISVIGNQLRADVTGLGDSVNIAARLLRFATDGAVCDYMTHTASAAIGTHSFHGEHLGKRYPIGVWSLVAGDSDGVASKPVSNAVEPIGYLEERDIIVTAARDWLQSDSKLVVVVEGPSGVGKTSLLNFAINAIEPYGVLIRASVTGDTPDDLTGKVTHVLRLAKIDQDMGSLLSPLLISTVLSSQRDTILENCELRDGVLYMKNDTNIQNLKLDLASGIQTQYDSLDAQFKTFLRYAASLGQYFDVALIVNVFHLDVPLEDFDTWVGARDSFAFLANATAASERECGYYFRHISILTCIYEGISFANRNEIHLKIANYLEDETAKSGTAGGVVGDEFVLPLVAYHFSKTNDFEKIVKYHSALSLVYSMKFMAHECIQTTQFLLATVKTRQAEIANRTRAADVPGVMPSEATVARWKYLLAESYALNGEFPKVVPLIGELMRIIGVRTTGATKDVKRKAMVDPELAALMYVSLGLMMQILLSDAAPITPVLKYQRLLTTLLLINAAILKSESEPVAIASTCAYLGCMLIHISPRLSRIYFKRYTKLCGRLPPELAPYALHSASIVGMILYVYGDADAARALMRIAVTSGGITIQHKFVVLACTLPTEFMRSQGGSLCEDFGDIVRNLEGFAELEETNNYHVMAMNASLIARHLLFAGYDADGAMWTEKMQKYVKRVGNRYHQAVFKMPIVVQNLFSGNLAEACNTYLSLALELQHRLPPFLEFGTMLPQLTFIGLMLLFPAPFASNDHAQAAELKKPVLQALSLLATANKGFVSELHCVLSLWAQYVAQALLSRFSGRKMRRSASLSKLKRMLEGKDGKKVKDWVVLRGYVFMTIALCDPSTTERQRYREAAEVEFSKTFVRLQAWTKAQLSE